jgi:hypothetical protein
VDQLRDLSGALLSEFWNGWPRAGRLHWRRAIRVYPRVMAGLVPAIYVFDLSPLSEDVDARDEARA